MTPDAQSVVWSTNSPDVLALDTNQRNDFVARHRPSGAVQPVSASTAGALQDDNPGSGWRAAIADSGRMVAFESPAANLVEDDTNGFPDVFVRELDDPASGWLRYLNGARTASGLPALAEDATWNEEAVAHARYTVRADVLAHEEQPSSPHFSEEGDRAARHGNVMASSNLQATDNSAIENWLGGPFHAVGLLDPELATTGFGSFREAGAQYQMAATLDVLRGFGPVAPEVQFPVLWPGRGAVVAVSLAAYRGGEYPNPLSSCSGYAPNSGLPLIVQVGTGAGAPAVSLSALTDETFPQALEHCVYTETTYTNPDAAAQNTGRAVLGARDAVVIVPRLPLRDGRTYRASLTIDGQAVDWTFSVASTTACGIVPEHESLSVPAAGGAVQLQVYATDGCEWSATSSYDWIAMTEGASGSGARTVAVTVEPNGTTSSRYGWITLGGKSVLLSQAASSACSYSIDTSSALVSASAGSGSVGVSAAAGCAWAATSGASWLSVSPASGSGARAVAYSYTANTSPASRVGTLTIAGRVFTVTQDGALQCSVSVEPASAAVGPAGSSLEIALTAHAASCPWAVEGAPAWLGVAPASGQGSATLTVTVQANASSDGRQAVLLIGGVSVTVAQGGAASGTPGAPVSPGPTSVVFLQTTEGAARVTFADVTAAGAVDSVCQHGGQGSAPEGHRLAVDHVFSFTESASLAYATAEVCVPFSETEISGAGLTVDALRLWQRAQGGAWVPVAGSGYRKGAGICASVSSLTEFTLGGAASFTAYLAEGATGSMFDLRIALVNPTARATTATLRFTPPAGPPVEHVVPVGAMARATVVPEALNGLEQAEFSTLVEADVPLVVDRTMSWDGSGYGSHAETSVASPSKTWYLAEGATHSGFDLFYLLQNPHPSDSSRVRVRYLRPGGAPLEKVYDVNPSARRTLWVDHEQFPDDSGDTPLADTDLSAVFEVVEGAPIVVERAMYRGSATRAFTAGHDSAGVTGTDTRWFLAEGATGSYFDLFVLIANPSDSAAEVRVTYLLDDGRTIVRRYGGPGADRPAVAANSRHTIWVDYETPELASAAVSTIVESTNGVGIIVERAMWWPGPTPATWTEAHNSPGATGTGTRWVLAEGAVGGPRATETYVLVANTSPAAGLARVTLLLEGGDTLEGEVALPANSRTTVNVAAMFPAAKDRAFGVVVESLASGPAPAAEIVVERAMYSSDGGAASFLPYWPAGTNALATKVR